MNAQVLRWSGALPAKDLNSAVLELIDEVTPIGGLDPAVDAYWKSQVVRPGVDTLRSDKTWLKTLGQAQWSGKGPSFGITEAAIFYDYVSQFPQHLQVSSTTEVDRIFPNQVVKAAGLTLFWDRVLEGSKLTLFPDAKAIRFQHDSEVYMSAQGWGKAPNQLARHEHIVTMAQFTCRGRRTSAKVLRQSVAA